MRRSVRGTTPRRHRRRDKRDSLLCYKRDDVLSHVPSKRGLSADLRTTPAERRKTKGWPKRHVAYKVEWVVALLASGRLVKLWNVLPLHNTDFMRVTMR